MRHPKYEVSKILWLQQSKIGVIYPSHFGLRGVFESKAVLSKAVVLSTESYVEEESAPSKGRANVPLRAVCSHNQTIITFNHVVINPSCSQCYQPFDLGLNQQRQRKAETRGAAIFFAQAARAIATTYKYRAERDDWFRLGGGAAAPPTVLHSRT